MGYLLMWRILFLFVIVSPVVAIPHNYYVSPAGSGTVCSSGTPCALQYALTTLSTTSDDVICGNSGTYTGRFASTLSGTSGHNITVKSCAGSWMVLDGYVHTTLNGAINSSATTIILTDASLFVDGNSTDIEVTIDNEVILLRNKSGNTFTNCLRGRAGGQAAASHSNGATVLATGQQVLLVQSGGYVTFRDFEILDSNPTRAYTTDQSSGGLAPQYQRPEGLYLDTPNISAINLVIHDCREGIGFWDAAYGGLVYGCVLYNNGFVDPVRGHGHGIYTQNTNAAGKQIKETISFNNYATGMKMYGVAGTANHYLVEGVISWNNGSPAAYFGNPAGLGTDTRESNLFAGTEQVAMDDVTVQQSAAYHEPNILTGSMNIGYDTTGSTNGLWQDNYVFGGIGGTQVIGWDSLIFRRNYVYAVNTTGTRSDNNLFQVQVRSGSLSNYNFNSNIYWDNTQANNGCPGAAGANRIPFYIDTVISNCNGGLGSPLDWNSTGGWVSQMTETGTTYTGGDPSSPIVLAARPNIYDANLAHAWTFSASGAATATISVAGIFNNGDSINVLPLEAGLAGGWAAATPFQQVTVSGNAVVLNTSGWSVIMPTGSSFTSATVAPKFAVWVLYRTAQATASSTVMSGGVKISGGVTIQ